MSGKIPLGAAVEKVGRGVLTQPQTLEERVTALTLQVEELTKAFHAVNSVRVKDKRRAQFYDSIEQAQNANKDGLPLGTSLIGTSMRGGIHVLRVMTDGYYIGQMRYDSLSAAAEASSGVRRSGWTFWRLPDGRSVKEAFGKA